MNICQIWEWLSNNKDSVIAIANILLTIVALSSIYFTYRSNKRAEKLFESQIKPLIQTKPVSFVMTDSNDELFGTIELQIVNHSNFKALNVRTDVKYHGPWIREWMIAAAKGMNNLEHKGLLTEEQKKELNIYRLSLTQNVGNIKPNKDLKQLWTGGLGNKKKYYETENKSISVRTLWKNQYGFEYENIEHYNIVITSAFESESVTIIPKEVNFKNE